MTDPGLIASSQQRSKSPRCQGKLLGTKTSVGGQADVWFPLCGLSPLPARSPLAQTSGANAPRVPGEILG